MDSDRARYLARRLKSIRRRLRQPCSGELFEALLFEGRQVRDELAEIEASHSRRARQPWKPAPPTFQRVKRQHPGFWRGLRPAGWRDHGQR